MYSGSRQAQQQQQQKLVPCENMEKICVLVDEKNKKKNIASKKKFTYYDIDTTVTVTADSLDTVLAFANDGVRYWLDLQLPSTSDIERVSKKHGIHQLTLESIVQQQSLQETMTIFTRYHYFVLALPGKHYHCHPLCVYSVVFDNCILTFHFEEIAEVTVIRDQVVKMEKFMVTTPAWINYVLIRSIVEKQYDLITGTEVCIRALNDEVTRTTYERPSDLECKISNIAADISTFTLALGSKLAIVNMMNKCLKQKGEPLVHYALVSPKSKVVATTYPGIAIHVEELQNRIVQALQNLERMDKLLALIHASFLAKVSIKLAEASNDTNLVIGRLTTFATVLLPMNLVTGLWGMNVKVPGEDNDSLVYFFWILSGLAILAMVLLTLARKSNLI